jgi:hypothetical protein
MAVGRMVLGEVFDHRRIEADRTAFVFALRLGLGMPSRWRSSMISCSQVATQPGWSATRGLGGDTPYRVAVGIMCIIAVNPLTQPHAGIIPGTWSPPEAS